jgi:DNA-binding response OmpR family regulator
MRVLIADSNGQRARERAEQLLIDGHDPLLAASAHAAHLKLAELPDVVLLGDLAGPAVTIGFLRALRAGTLHRADSRVPVIVIGADTDSDRIRYYQAGGDALLASDSSPLLIAAALEAVHRRAGALAPRLLSIAGVRIDLDARTVQAEDQPLALTRLEFDLLRTLASQPGRTFTRDEITREVWGYDPAAAGPSRTVDSTAHRLRRKLEQAGTEQLMHSVRGVGWRLGR